MSVSVVPHLNFRGEARAALEFYQTVFSGELTIVTYEDLHSVQQPEDASQVMWGQVSAANGFKVMAFDATPTRLPFERGSNSFYVACRFDTDEEANTCWKKLKDGATIRQELAPAPWGPMLYGMLEDKFGIVWIFDTVSGTQAPA